MNAYDAINGIAKEIVLSGIDNEHQVATIIRLGLGVVNQPDSTSMNAKEVVSILLPLASLAESYDSRVYPPDRDTQQVGVELGILRRAKVILDKLQEQFK